jgi:hypothetical protein
MKNLTLLLPNLSRSRVLHFLLVASRDRYVHEKYENGHETLNEVFTVSFIAFFSEKTSILLVLKFKSSRNINIFMNMHSFAINYNLKIIGKKIFVYYFCKIIDHNVKFREKSELNFEKSL